LEHPGRRLAGDGEIDPGSVTLPDLYPPRPAFAYLTGDGHIVEDNLVSPLRQRGYDQAVRGCQGVRSAVDSYADVLR